MLFFCPGCQRTFDESGFCPFDRTPLVSLSEARTTGTSPMRAADEPHDTAVEQHVTFPLTPSPPVVPAAAPAQAPAPAPAPAMATAVATGSERTEPEPRSEPEAMPEDAPATEPVPRGSTGPAPGVDPASAVETAPSGDVPPLRAAPAQQDPQQAPSASDSGRGRERERPQNYDLLVGQTLDGRYYIEQKIGEGGMGVVFAARHVVIERPLAIKVLKREVMRDTATTRRFVQEAKAASRIGHPNIVDVTDFGTTPDGMTYSVMEYVSGQTLGAAIREGAPFAMDRAARIAAQLSRALGAAHDKGIVHRDLKPENVFLVDRDGRPDFVKIVDFGIAKVTPVGQGLEEPRLTRAGSVFGTPEYMAPEQAAGKSDTDGRVDIYALGVILYQMVTGRVPHKGESMVRTLAMQMLDPAEPPTKVRPDLGIHPELEAVIMKALAKKREQRFQTMGELLAALEALLPPINLGASGSFYALAPLPPGADPALVAATPPQPYPALAVGAAAATPPQPYPALAASAAAATPPQPYPALAASAAAGASAPTPWPPPMPVTQQPASTPATPQPHPMSGTPIPGTNAAAQPHAPQPLTGATGGGPRPGDYSGGPSSASGGDSSSSGDRATPPAGTAAVSTARRLRDEPEFVSSKKPLVFESAFADEPPPAARRSWPILLLLGASVVGATAAITVVVRSRIGTGPSGPPASAPPHTGSSAVALAPAPAPDTGASPATAPPADIAAPPPAGASPTEAPGAIAVAPPGAGTPRPPVGPPDTGSAAATALDPQRRVDIQVTTKPAGASLFVGKEYRGPSGTHLAEPLGTQLDVTCKQAGYKDGRVKLVFDGKRQAASCVLERVVVCIPGVKNPFDNCPD